MPCKIERFFHRHRHTVERGGRMTCRQRRTGCTRRFPRGFCVEHDDCVQLGIEAVDTIEIEVESFNSRYFPLANCGGEFQRAFVPKILT